MNQALEEFKFQLSGLVESESLSEIGKFVGANYIMSITFNDTFGYISTGAYWHSTTERQYKLIEIESMKTMSIDFIRDFTVSKNNDRYSYRTVINGKDIVVGLDGNRYYK